MTKEDEISIRIVSLVTVIISFTIMCIFFFFNDTATTEIYTLSLHDALPISPIARTIEGLGMKPVEKTAGSMPIAVEALIDRKSTRLNSSHLGISYAVFCLKKKHYHLGNEPGLIYSTLHSFLESNSGVCRYLS